MRGELQVFATKVTIVVAVGLTLLLLWFARDVLVLIFIAAVLAAGIAPAVRKVQLLWRFWFHRRLPRGTAVMVVYLPFVVTVLFLIVVLAPRVIADLRTLGAQLPVLIDRNILTPLERYVPVGYLRQELHGGIAVPRANVIGYVRNAATAIAEIVAVLFMIAYMLIDAERLRNLILLVFPPDVRAERRETIGRMARRMSAWLSAQLILSAIIGIATFITLLALRIPYALPLAILAAIGEMVPVIGPTVGAIPSLTIALLHSRWQFWSVLVMAIVLQKAENLFIVPRVMARKVSISPLAVFIAFMMGGSLLGIAGAIMAIPVAAIVQVGFEEVFVKRRERRQDAVRSGTLLRRVD